MAEPTLERDADLQFVCSLTELQTVRKKRITVHNKDIFIVKAKDKLYALDSFCYHAGGPLHNGDIEATERNVMLVRKITLQLQQGFSPKPQLDICNKELGGRMCVVCPWHKYKVCVDTGQNYYQSIDPSDLSKPARWTVGDVRQRTHRVVVQDGSVYVALSQVDGTLDSDHHNTRDQSDT